MALTLKQARQMQGKSQLEMAELIKIHVKTYQRLEEKPDKTTIEQAKKIASYLKISYDRIFLLNNSTF